MRIDVLNYVDPKSKRGIMDKFVIQGGKKLSGTVEIQASKNAALPILAATLLVEKGETVINNLPDLVDVDVMLGVMEQLGAKVRRSEDDRSNKQPAGRKVVINAERLKSFEAPYDLVRKMRASFLVMGPLLARPSR